MPSAAAVPRLDQTSAAMCAESASSAAECASFATRETRRATKKLAPADTIITTMPMPEFSIGSPNDRAAITATKPATITSKRPSMTAETCSSF